MKKISLLMILMICSTWSKANDFVVDNVIMTDTIPDSLRTVEVPVATLIKLKMALMERNDLRKRLSLIDSLQIQLGATFQIYDSCDTLVFKLMNQHNKDKESFRSLSMKNKKILYDKSVIETDFRKLKEDFLNFKVKHSEEILDLKTSNDEDNRKLKKSRTVWIVTSVFAIVLGGVATYFAVDGQLK